jgi:hypothetical protein
MRSAPRDAGPHRPRRRQAGPQLDPRLESRGWGLREGINRVEDPELRRWGMPARARKKAERRRVRAARFGRVCSGERQRDEGSR